MSEGDYLLREILTHQEDDQPRLAYADWLQENGQAARGEFIRSQVEAASRGEECPDDVRALLPDDFSWLGLRPPEQFEITWARGFVDSIVTPSRYFWNAKRLQKLFGQHPINEVYLTDLLPFDYVLAEGWFCGWWPGGWSETILGSVPDNLFSRMPAGELCFLSANHDYGVRHGWFLSYSTEDDAFAALNPALVSYGRSQAGLPSKVFLTKGEGIKMRR